MRLLLVTLLCFASSLAWAQPPEAAALDAHPPSTDSSLAEARAHHLRGVAALEANDLQTAERAFYAALALTFRASTAYNLALVLTEQARPAEALELYQRVLALPDSELPRDREGIEFDRDRAAGIQAHVNIAITGVDSAQLRVDGAPAGAIDGGAERAFALDPGEHRLDAESEGLRVAETLRLAAGERRAVTLAFSLVSSEPDVSLEADARDPEQPQRRRRRRRLAGWIIAGALVVGGAVVLGIVLSNPEPTGGFDEPPFGQFDALSAGVTRP